MCFLRQKVNITVGNIKYNWLLKIGVFFVKILRGWGVGGGEWVLHEKCKNILCNCLYCLQHVQVCTVNKICYL